MENKLISYKFEEYYKWKCALGTKLVQRYSTVSELQYYREKNHRLR
jgi:hypothetical protein